MLVKHAAWPEEKRALDQKRQATTPNTPARVQDTGRLRDFTSYKRLVLQEPAYKCRTSPQFLLYRYVCLLDS
jgi:hypothetical protein